MSAVFVILTILFVIAVVAVRPGAKGILAIIAVSVNALISSWIAVGALTGSTFTDTFSAGIVFGQVTLQLDPLSGWFILLTNFTMLTGLFYGRQYLKKYQVSPSTLSLHYSAYIINHAALTGIYFLRHTLAFLCSWELMALSAFIMVIFEHGKIKTIKAGINYLIQSHISIVLLTLGFIWVYASTGSFDFTAITRYCSIGGHEASLLLFLVFFAGFAIKAGFVPFHTWLPHAHPAAPSHVSGVMSGIIIKTGIYGILRMLLLMPDNKMAIGYIILGISVISGVYGVMLAIVQHNLKRLLAYHSIENIGIIGIGIGVGTIGVSLNNNYMAFAGYAGALLHTLNHSLFKSLLFFSAGSVYNAIHTLAIDKMGGLIKKMPYTAFLFLFASLAICGLPPLNGFISEFLIYSGLFEAVGSKNAATLFILAVIGLALIGGLAMLCFTKAFGIIFLGTERQQHDHVAEVSRETLWPKFIIAAMIGLIGLFPWLFIAALQKPVGLFTVLPTLNEFNELTGLMQQISITAWIFLGLIGIIYLLRRHALSKRSVLSDATWGCGYPGMSTRMQYTASSFVRPYVKIVKPVLSIKKDVSEVSGIFPDKAGSETHFYDKIESRLVDWPTRHLRGFLGRFKFLQNGSVQFYVLYGVVFIGICIAIPLVIDGFRYLIDILKTI